MSSSSSSSAPAHRRSHQSRGGGDAGPQKQRYVPKQASSSNPSATLVPNSGRSLSSSLRSSANTAGVGSSESAGSFAGVCFVEYLPADEAVAAGFGAEAGAFDAVEAQKVVDFLNEKLENILLLQPREFWREVAKNESLHQFLDSYLQFRRRWYDLPHQRPRGSIAGVVVGELELCRRVFMVLYRMSANKEPGAASRDTLSLKDHTALLQEKKLLSLPKLLDICAIYGHDNQELTRLLVTNAVKAQPELVNDFTSAAFVFLELYRTMHNRCMSSFEELNSPTGYNGGKDKYQKVLSDVLDFVNDAVVSLDSLTDAYEPAALLFAQASNGTEELLGTLAGVHDSLLPSILQAFKMLSVSESSSDQKVSGSDFSDIVLGSKMLLRRTARFGWRLLEFCYLNEELTEHDVQSVNKMFPVKVEDPGIRGDILVQTLKDISKNTLLENPENRTFLQVIEREFQLLSKVSSLRSRGWMYMEEEQFTFLSQLTASVFLSATSTEPAIRGSAENDEESAILESKIGQIKDLFPDYGKGFLAACLEAYSQNTEEVIQRILEGTVHEDLLALGTSLEHLPERKLEDASRKDKGKGILLESGPQVVTNPVKNPTSQMRGVKGASSSSSLSNYGRYTRKTNDELPATKILDSISDKAAVRSSVLAAGYEYEDEYDDSFDDVGFKVESDYHETETDERTAGSSDGTAGARNEASASNSGTRWSQQKKTQFYVKDGKNYSYKVSGAIAVSSARDAAMVNEMQKDVIYGLGRGGNIPFGATNRRYDLELAVGGKREDSQLDKSVHSNYHGRGAQRGVAGAHEIGEDPAAGTADAHGRGGANTRGRGGRGGRNHYRKDRAMKKHVASLGGFNPA